MAESERYLPRLASQLEGIFAQHGLGDAPITMRLAGCPNGCSRPYVAEIGLTGRYAQERREGEPFGDFAIRAGYVRAVSNGREFNE